MRLLVIGPLRAPLIEATRMAMQRGAAATTAESIAQGLDFLRKRGADLLIVDVTLDIAALIRALEDERIATPVIACGTKLDKDAASAAIAAGARDFLPLPPDAELIAAMLEAVTDSKPAFVWRDPAMERVVSLAEKIAASDASVMITGESGTGKEVMARFLHERSKRKTKPFVSVNCAALPEGLLESELFGHERGAFTGAVARRIGKFEEADGGTLLLDEISEMEARLQAKLLRALQERVIDRVGGGKPVPVDIRVLATSNRKLEEEVRAGRFRQDLYYRLNVVALRLPPLRERPADVLALSEHFIQRFAASNGLPVRPLAEAAKRQLLTNPWRGNVRELENVLHRAVLVASGAEIGSDALIGMGDAYGLGEAYGLGDDIDKAAARAGSVLTRDLVGRSVADVERGLILDTLDHCGGNRTHAARVLGISIRTLRNKLHEYAAEHACAAQSGAGHGLAVRAFVS
jgi:two-component system response regulator FlrC